MNQLKKYKWHLLIFISAFVLYANTINHDYVWDDAIVITHNQRVQNGLADIPSFFKSYRSDKVQDRYGFRPITLLTFATEVHFFGLNPKVGHFTNIILYALTCLVFYIFLSRIFPKHKEWIILGIVAIFMVHPAHTEVVANIKSRDEILVVFFGLVSLIFHWKHLETKSWLSSQTLWALLFFLLAVLSKENAVTLIAFYFLLSFLHTNPTAKNLFKGNLYLILLVLLFSSTWVYSHSNIGLEDQLNQAFDSGMYQEDGFISNPLLDLPSIWDRIPNGIYLAYRYLVFFIFPYPLLHDYGYAVVPVVQWTAPIVWLSLGIILGIAFLGYKFYRKSRGFLIGYLLFLAGISVFLHVVIPGPDHFAERFLFLPSVGLSIALVFALSLLLSKKAFGYVLCAVLLIFTSLTYHRNQDWASTFILLDSDIEKLQNCSRANFNYANELEFLSYKNPNPNQSNSMKLTALKHYSKSWKISKRSYKAIIAQGRLYMELGNYPKGLQSFKEAVKEYPQLIEPHLMLSKSYISVNQFDSSLVVLKKAEQTGMQIPDIYYLKGISYLKKNQLDSAIMSLYRCQNLKSENIEHYLLPAEMLITNGSYIKSLFVESKRDPLTEASKLLEDAQRIDPQNGKLKYLIEMLKNKSKSQ